jgi:uncharacterized membrane protein YdbT with pleckstrin-like domain
MSYIDKSLGEGETVIARARFSWLYTVAAWGAFLVPLVLLIIASGWAGQQPDAYAMGNPVTWGLILLAAWLAVGIVTFIRKIILRSTTEIGVTTHRFVEKYGVLSMRTNEIALPNIEGVKVNQSFLGRIFGYGTVRIEGTGVDAVTTPNIADPVGFVRAIQTAKEHA